MSLVYRFKKERLESGVFVSRPRVLVVLNGNGCSIEVPALIDSGCDVTVIPAGIASALGIDTAGEKERLYAYRESTDVVQSDADITFVGKAVRESVRLRIPVLVALPKDGFSDEEDITLGIAGVFDTFDITFRKASDRIVLKKAR